MLGTPTRVLALDPRVLPFLHVLLGKCLSFSILPLGLSVCRTLLCLPGAIAVFVEQSAQGGSRGSTGVHMNTSQLLSDRRKAGRGLAMTWSCQDKHNNILFMTECLGFTLLPAQLPWFLLSLGNLVLSCPFAAPCSAQLTSPARALCCTRWQCTGSCLTA